MFEPIEHYDRIGRGYARERRPDPRIAEALSTALGDAVTVANVGAGTGSYEPVDRTVVAIEPSTVMIRQRPLGAAPVVRARAENLPLADDAVDAALAVLTVHHWSDPARGLAEIARVARFRVVVMTWDPSSPGFWLERDYFPEMLEINREVYPPMSVFREALGRVTVTPLPLPHDLTDGFVGAHWRRPEAYLSDAARGSMSSFSRIGNTEEGLALLRSDLRSGSWARRNAAVLERREMDLGYRIVVSG